MLALFEELSGTLLFFKAGVELGGLGVYCPQSEDASPRRKVKTDFVYLLYHFSRILESAPSRKVHCATPASRYCQYIYIAKDYTKLYYSLSDSLKRPPWKVVMIRQTNPYVLQVRKPNYMRCLNVFNLPSSRMQRGSRGWKEMPILHLDQVLALKLFLFVCLLWDVQGQKDSTEAT